MLVTKFFPLLSVNCWDFLGEMLEWIAFIFCGLGFGVVDLLDRQLPKAREHNLPCYLTYNCDERWVGVQK